jgi:predicted alpha-1,2-mannosidase
MPPIAVLFALLAGFAPPAQSAEHAEDRTPLVDYVRPLVGTQGGGNTFPGPSASFGAVQLSPDTDRQRCAGYTWYAPQDVPALIRLMGGEDNFTRQLDALFEFDGGASRTNLEQGKIGEYWHGNEPGHHTIYLYCYAGRPWKAAECLQQVLKTQYGNQPDSLRGNDDCGQMSAWYIFTAMGLYPVCPASDCYVIGAPGVSKAVIHLSNGKIFTMTAENLSEANLYVQSARLNGKDWNNPVLPCSQVERGGALSFVMGPKPSPWGTHPRIPE